MTRFRNVLLYSVLILGTMTFWQNCGKFEPVDFEKAQSSTNSPTANAYFKKVNVQVLQPQCVSCHNAALKSGGVDYSSYQAMMATGSVVAGNPGQSALLESVLDGSMPQGGARLNVSEINLISTWIANGAKGNELPVANAGADKTVFLGAGVSLPGSGMDPDGVIVTYAWSQVSGPSVAVLANANSSSAATANLMLGTYVFRLTVTDDDGVTASDDVSVTVAQPVSFATLNTSIFQGKCVSCHSQALMFGNYDMSSYTGVVKDVVPGNAALSKLYQRVLDNSMPPGAPLSQTEKDSIGAWINQGALNN